MVSKKVPLSKKKAALAGLNLSTAKMTKQERAIEVEITGEEPGLLMNSPQAMLDQARSKSKKSTEKPTPEESAESSAYKMKDGTLCLHSEHLKGSLINSSGAYKIGKKGAAQFVAGTVRVWPREISLGTKQYEIDIRPVVIQRNRILKARALLPEWKARFYLIYDPTYGITGPVLKAMLTEAGRRVGVLDFRPQHRGEFGRYNITYWKEL